MEIRYSQHALDRMSERGMSEEAIEKALKPPNKIKDGHGSSKIAVKGNIRVVYTHKGNYILIVSVTTI